MAYDHIIVGGGTAGVVLATRLTEDPGRSVLMIEAGPDYPDVDTMPDDVKGGNDPWNSAFQGGHSWGYAARATRYRDPFPLPAGKVVGGSSSINGQVFLRGVPADYDEWAEAGNDQWSFEGVLPYFNRSEHDLDFGDGEFHGDGGPIPVRRIPKENLPPNASAFWDACLAEGLPETLDANHPDSVGVGPRPLNNRDRMRMSTALTYLPLARGRANLTIMDNARVTRIVFDGQRAVGVEVDRDGETERIEGGETIVSAGAFNSPQLLMLSGMGPADHLTCFGFEVVHDLPGVGENLQDHPSVYLLYRATIDAVDEDTPPSQAGLRFRMGDSPHENDMQITPTLRTSEHRPHGYTLEDFVPYAGFTVGLQKPMSTGRLRLASADPVGQPAMNFNYLSKPSDLQRLRDAVRFAARLTQRSEFGPILLERIHPTDDALADDEALDRWLLENVATQLHSCGTCKMGPASDPMAVVDQHCRVHGVEGLRVVDASIMPSVIRANTNATVIMAAEKIADDIRNGF